MALLSFVAAAWATMLIECSVVVDAQSRAIASRKYEGGRLEIRNRVL
jgi:hypothetical protein